MLSVKDGVEVMESWQGEGEYVLSESPLVYDGWCDVRVYCETPLALEHAVREYRSNYHVLPYAQKVVTCAW